MSKKFLRSSNVSSASDFDVFIKSNKKPHKNKSIKKPVGNLNDSSVWNASNQSKDFFSENEYDYSQNKYNSVQSSSKFSQSHIGFTTQIEERNNAISIFQNRSNRKKFPKKDSPVKQLLSQDLDSSSSQSQKEINFRKKDDFSQSYHRDMQISQPSNQNYIKREKNQPLIFQKKQLKPISKQKYRIEQPSQMSQISQVNSQAQSQYIQNAYKNSLKTPLYDQKPKQLQIPKIKLKNDQRNSLQIPTQKHKQTYPKIEITKQRNNSPQKINLKQSINLSKRYQEQSKSSYSSINNVKQQSFIKEQKSYKPYVQPSSRYQNKRKSSKDSSKFQKPNYSSQKSHQSKIQNFNKNKYQKPKNQYDQKHPSKRYNRVESPSSIQSFKTPPNEIYKILTNYLKLMKDNSRYGLSQYKLQLKHMEQLVQKKFVSQIEYMKSAINKMKSMTQEIEIQTFQQKLNIQELKEINNHYDVIIAKLERKTQKNRDIDK